MISFLSTKQHSIVTNFEWVQKHYGMSRYRWSELRRLERVLHKWAEDECNGRIQWHEEDGKEVPYLYGLSEYGEYTRCKQQWHNVEADCLAEARRHAAACGLEVYHQGDPRGCALYLYSQADLDERLERNETLRQPGMGIGACYNSVGTAIC